MNNKNNDNIELDTENVTANGEEETSEDHAENSNENESQPLKEIESLKKDLSSKTELLLRTAAEYENYRKRTEREKASIYADATAFAVSAILPIADSLERAMQSLEGINEEYKKGLDLIKNQLNDSFKTLGVESFGEKGDKFNPDIHNAISHIENDELDENVISEVFQKGYKLTDKIIRYAMVQAAN